MKTRLKVIFRGKMFIYEFVIFVSAFIKGPTMVGKKGPTIWSL